jgi:hypothetical protein
VRATGLRRAAATIKKRLSTLWAKVPPGQTRSKVGARNRGSEAVRIDCPHRYVAVCRQIPALTATTAEALRLPPSYGPNAW